MLADLSGLASLDIFLLFSSGWIIIIWVFEGMIIFEGFV
jgi:hypothetical protein